MGQVLARDVEDIRRSFGPTLDRCLDGAWVEQERQVAKDALLGFSSKHKCAPPSPPEGEGRGDLVAA